MRNVYRPFMLASLPVLAVLGCLLIKASNCRATEACSANCRSVVDLAGRKVSLPEKVRKVACLDVLCYQKLFALGVSDKVALMYFTDAPWMKALNPGVTKVAQTFGAPNIEDLLLRHVDLAFFAYDTALTAKKLDSVGIRGVVSQPQGLRAQTIDDFVKQIKQSVLIYGEVMAGEALVRARQWCAYFQSRVDYVTSRINSFPDSPRPRVYYVRGPTAMHTQGRSGDTFWYGKMAGGDMVVKNDVLAAKGPVSMEKIIEWDPEVVLIGRQYPAEIVLKDSRWRNISAVRNHRVYLMPNGVFYWDGGLEGVLLMEFLAKKLHPELFPDLDMAAELKKFYSQFYRFALSDDQIRRMLAGLDPQGTRLAIFNN